MPPPIIFDATPCRHAAFHYFFISFIDAFIFSRHYYASLMAAFFAAIIIFHYFSSFSLFLLSLFRCRCCRDAMPPCRHFDYRHATCFHTPCHCFHAFIIFRLPLFSPRCHFAITCAIARLMRHARDSHYAAALDAAITMFHAATAIFDISLDFRFTLIEKETHAVVH